MRYQFKLEALRRYRRFQEESMQKELSEALRRQEMEAVKLSRMQERRTRTEMQLKQDQAGHTTSPHLSIYHNYLERISSDIVNQEMELERSRKQSEEKREALVLAMQKRKTLEKLKENGLKAHLQNLSREEEKFINEMAISRFIMNPKQR